MPESSLSARVFMAYSSIVKEVLLGGEAIRLLMQDETPIVEFRDQYINHLWILCQQCELLNHPPYLNEFAEVSNFLWKGTSFQFIESIEKYQKNYNNQVELEKKNPSDVFPYRLTDYKLFNVSTMHEPRLIEDRLHFFVFNTTTGLPYRVVCPFPYTSLSPFVHYQILPLRTALD